MNSNAPTPTASKPTGSKNQSYAQTLTSWLESSPDSLELQESLEAMAGGNAKPTMRETFLFLLDNLTDPMPPNLPPVEMFDHLESQYSERRSEGDHYGPEK